MAKKKRRGRTRGVSNSLTPKEIEDFHAEVDAIREMRKELDSAGYSGYEVRTLHRIFDPMRQYVRGHGDLSLGAHAAKRALTTHGLNTDEDKEAAMPDFIEITCDIKHVTERAVLINDGDEDVWLPLSQVDEDSLPEWEGEELKAVTIEAKEWILKDKGLI